MMRSQQLTFISLYSFLAWIHCLHAQSPEPASYLPLIEKLAPLHKKMGPPKPGDWLATHKEPGQTFVEYVRSNPVKPSGYRQILYVQPLGEFSPSQLKIVQQTVQYMQIYFGLTVITKPAIGLDEIPNNARRQQNKHVQLHTKYILHQLLKPRLPKNALATIAFTAEDLYPGDGWNYVFGQASTRNRVGVWSLRRFGNPDESPEAYHQCLRRTIQVACHETSHMLTMRHCTAYECLMAGSNSLDESDRRPIYNCPECVAKVSWATGSDLLTRYRALHEYADELDLTDARVMFERSILELKKK